MSSTILRQRWGIWSCLLSLLKKLRRIQNLTKHVRWLYFVKIGNGSHLLTNFEKAQCCMFNSILNTPLRSVTPCVPNTGKYGPEKTPYLETRKNSIFGHFHAVDLRCKCLWLVTTFSLLNFEYFLYISIDIYGFASNIAFTVEVKFLTAFLNIHNVLLEI